MTLRGSTHDGVVDATGGSTTRSVVLLGSTGSIGTQAIDVIHRHPGDFRVTALSAAGGRPELLADQAFDLGVDVVAVEDYQAADVVRALLTERWAGRGATRHGSAGGAPAGATNVPEVLAGPEAAAAVAASGADIVLNGITGAVGLGPTLAALAAGSTLALANKESLVAGGALVKAAVQRPDQLVPVDSEHSAMAQALRGGRQSEVRRLILTASGGPFRGWNREQLRDVTVEQALAHPTWSMGPVVTINSATLMNKALELIEAHLLFDVPVSDITVVVHPQSVVHSAVEFHDGSTLAQASPPDMRLPIALALSWPNRLDHVAVPCDWSSAARWDFEPLDNAVFPALDLARVAVRSSKWHPAVLNAANEVAVDAFRHGTLPFLGIVDTVSRVVSEADHMVDVAATFTVESVVDIQQWAVRRAAELTGR